MKRVLSRKTGFVTVAAAAAMLAAVTGCGSSSKSSATTSTTPTSGSPAGSAGGTAAGSSGSSGGTKTVNVGILTDITGISASSNKSSVQGFEAGINWAATQGYNIKYVVADTTSSPQGTLSAAQKLVDQDHVLAVLADSSFTFAAAPFLQSHGIPVVGTAQDASEWTTDKNMFSSYGAIHTNEVSTTEGSIFKLLGATKIGSLGYSISPSSAEAAKAVAVSSEAVGLKPPTSTPASPSAAPTFSRWRWP